LSASRRSGFGRGSILVLVLWGCGPDRAAPQLHRVLPNQVVQAQGGVIRVEGESLYGELRDPFWSWQGASVDTGFRLWVGQTQLETSALLSSAPHLLEVQLPPGLPLGLHPLRVVTPGGREAVLEQALEIVEVLVPVLVVASAPVEVAAGACSVEIQVVRRAGGLELAAPEDVPLSVEVPGAGASLFSQPDCTGPALMPTLAQGESMARFHLQASVAGSHQLVVSGGGHAAVTQPLTVVAGPTRALRWEAIPPVREGLPFSVTVRAEDALGNPTPGFNQPLDLSLEGEGQLACVQGCSAGTQTTALAEGGWSGQLSLTIASGATRALTATAGALSGTSAPFEVLATRSPPSARLHGAPVIVYVDGTISFDAGGSSDAQSPGTSLEYSFDFSGSTAPPPWSPWSTTPTASHTFTADGYFTVKVAVRDPDGDLGYATSLVLVQRPQERLCTVDDPSATLDDGATGCAAPGPGGRVSLAEAFRLSAGGSGPKGIRIAPGVRVQGPATFPIDGQWWVMASPRDGAVLEGVRFTVPADSSLIIAGLELTAPGAELLTVATGGFAALENSRAHDFTRLAVAGSLWTYRAELSGCTQACVHTTGTGSGAVLRYSTVSASTVGVLAEDCANNGLQLAGTVLTGNQVGLRTAPACDGSVLVNLTFDGNQTGVELEGATHLVRNAIFSSNGTALRCLGSPAVTEESSLLFANTSDGCAGGGTGLLRADPRFWAPGAGDYRLDLSSPAIDSGADPGVDLNDVAPGSSLGAGPDRGGRESW